MFNRKKKLRRPNEVAQVEGPLPKKVCTSLMCTTSFDLKHREFLTDISGKKWRLGKAVGVGGFGEIYLASDNLNQEVKTDSLFVAKIENHKNGPLFVEVNCYLRIAKADLIEEWKKKHKLEQLGMPHYVASGSHLHKGEKYRFLILPRFEKDLEKILDEKKKLNLKTVLTISRQIMEVLEYIHSKGYIHSDIKASNLLLGGAKKCLSSVECAAKSPVKVAIRNKHHNPMRTCRMKPIVRSKRNLRTVKHKINYEESDSECDSDASIKSRNNVTQSTDQVYLLDYGLASKFLSSNGDHKPFCLDERKAHAGTLLFCSRDAHKGVTSRRSDLESLGYNMIYWLTGYLPWIKDLEDPELVAKKKQRAFLNIENFLSLCFDQCPKFLMDYFQYLLKLQFQENPDYNYLKKLFKDSLRDYGYKDDSRFDFDNLEAWDRKQKKCKRGNENFKSPRMIMKISRPPLQSNNIPIVPLLRKKVKKGEKFKQLVRWSQIFVDNPETIMKQARKHSDNHDAVLRSRVLEMNMAHMNPTYAMWEVYNRCKERGGLSPSYKGDSGFNNIEGYTPAMMAVLRRMKERQEFEYEQAVNARSTKAERTRGAITRSRKKEIAKKKPARRLSKSTSAKKDCGPTRRVKTLSLRRSYSLRG